MKPRSESRITDMHRFRLEVVTKVDGRYLIYYSWPDEAAVPAGDGDAPAAPAGPEQAPWSPEAGPPDV